MRTKFFLVLGYGTLAIDVYLVLASIATRMMDAQYHHYLPPFGSDGVAGTSCFAVLLVATWTAVLAMGCLKAAGQSERTLASGTIWFVVVLGVVWLAYLVPAL